jgi:hypothetical protein
LLLAGILHSAVVLAEAAATGWKLRLGIGSEGRRDRRNAEHNDEQRCQYTAHGTYYDSIALRNQEKTHHEYRESLDASTVSIARRQRRIALSKRTALTDAFLVINKVFTSYSS